MKIRGSVLKYNDIKKIITDPEEEDCVYVERDKTVYVYRDSEWVARTEKDSLGLQLTQYDINKMVLPQMPDYTDFDTAKRLIREVTHQHNTISAGYYMLLCKDLSYYTTFIIDKNFNNEKVEDVVLECIDCLGTLKDIWKDEEQNSLELWFVDNNNEAHVAMLFDYEWGIIKCV